VNSHDTWTHIQMVVGILVPLGSGIAWILKRQSESLKEATKAAKSIARIEVKVDTMWEWFTNHGSDLTGYKSPSDGDEQ
jgi:uncharacterized membrane protein